MAGRIQGITVEIGGDTTKLSSALKGVNSEIKSTQSQLKDVEKLLKLDPKNTELLAQKQKLLTQEISATKEKLETLKTAAQQANEQLQKGEITQEQYDALQREIAETEAKLKSLESQASTTNQTLLKIGEVGQKMQAVGDSIKYAGAVCGSLGISIEDAAIATGLMGNAGIKASNAGTALRTGLTNLVKPTDQMAAAMKKYGVEIKTNSDGSVNLMDTMVNLRSALGGLDKTQQAAAISAIFGKNAMSGWSAIVNASEDDFNALTEAIYSADGAAQEAAAIKLDNLSGQITILKSTIEGIAIPA